MPKKRRAPSLPILTQEDQEYLNQALKDYDQEVAAILKDCNIDDLLKEIGALGPPEGFTDEEISQLLSDIPDINLDDFPDIDELLLEIKLK